MALAVALRRVLTPGTPDNRLLRIGLVAVALVPTIRAFLMLALNYPLGVDLEIPLRAAQRWVEGGIVYDPASFAQTGADLPYLYPPALLPFLVPLLRMQREIVLVAWVLVCLGGVLWALRRLRTPWPAVPLLLIWPPFAEATIGGNVQMLLFALFISLFIARDGRAPALHPRSRDPAASDEPPVRRGLQASLIAAFKVSQPHSWLYQLRYRPASALLGLALLGAVVLATVPVTGLAIWGDWVEQVRLASDTSWDKGGLGVGQYLGSIAGFAVAIGCAAAIFFVPRKEAGAWVGVLGVVGGTSLRVFGLTFLLPAGYRIRRELALVAYMLVGTFTAPGAWAGIAVVAVAWLAAQRYPVLLEPTPAGSGRVDDEPVSSA